MADPLQVELVAADRVVWSGKAREILARTSEGDLGVLADHAPLLSLLIPGVVVITPADGPIVRAAVAEGFLSVSDNHVSILSEDIFLADEVKSVAIQEEIAIAKAADDIEGLARAEAKLRLIDKAS